MSKQITFGSFKTILPTNYSFTNHKAIYIYIYINIFLKQYLVLNIMPFLRVLESECNSTQVQIHYFTRTPPTNVYILNNPNPPKWIIWIIQTEMKMQRNLFKLHSQKKNIFLKTPRKFLHRRMKSFSMFLKTPGLVGWLFYGISTLFRSFNAKLKFKQFSLALAHSLNVKTILFQAIQFSISTQFSSIWPIDRTLSGATTLG